MASGQTNGLCATGYVCCGASSCCLTSACETCTSGACVGCVSTSVCCSGTCTACRSYTFQNTGGSSASYRYKPCTSAQCNSNTSGTLGAGASITLCAVSGSAAWNTVPSPGTITDNGSCAAS